MKFSRLLTIGVLFSLLLAGCKPGGENNASIDGDNPQATMGGKETLVRVMKLEKSSISRTIDYNSTLQAYEEVYVAPAQPGRIEEIYVEPGDRVSKGQKLFLMDQTQLYQTRIQLQSMKVDMERMETLLETGSITQQAYDQLKTQYDVTNSSLKFLEENTVMYAPFSGIITARYYENGEMYSGAPNTQAGKAAVVTLMQINPLKAILKVSENYYPLIKKGMEASVIADVYPDKEYSGKVILVYPVIDPVSRSFQVEIEVPNSSGTLKPGMFGRVSMFVGEDETFVVPANTVLQQEGTNIRYMFVEENGMAKRYNVLLGKRFDEKVEILSQDVKEGSKIIFEGHTKLLEGDKVKVVD